MTPPTVSSPWTTATATSPTVQRDSTTGDPTAIVAPFGQQTTLTLDANGYLASIADPANETFQLTSTSTGLLKQLTDPRGGIHKFSYDAVGRLTKDEDPAGGFKTLARSETPNGSTTSVSTGLGHTTTYLSELLANGAQRRVTTEPGGAMTEVVTNADGSWRTTYPSGTVVVVVPGPDPRWGMQAPIVASSTITTPGALVETITGSRTATLADAADPFSLLTQTDKRSINGRTWTTVYTAAAKTLVRTSPAGRAVTSTLDARGRVVQQQVAGLLAETFTYDGHGRLSTEVQGTGSGTRTTTLSYDSDGLLETLTDPLAQASSFAYDAVGRLTSETLPGGRTVAFGYDASGNLTSLTPPGAAAHAFGYTSADLDASDTPPALPGGPTPTTYTHDIDRGLTRVTRPDAVHVDVAYDASGRAGTVTLPAGAIAFGYDAANRLASTSAPGAVGLAYGYDGDLLTSGTLSGPVAGSVAGSYDTTFRVASLRVNGVNPISFGYDNDDLMTSAGALALTWHAQTGLLTGTTLGVVTDAWTYNGFAEPATRIASVNGTPQWSQTYTRDKLGRVTTLAETIGGVGDTYDYAYDAAGRLTEVQKNGSTIETYTYDANGNRLSFTGTGGPQLATYDVQDRLTNYKGNTYTYTKSGELQAKGAGASMTSYGYDPLGNLLSVTLPNATAITYVVDGRQRRVGKKVNGTLVQGFLYQDDLRPVAELNGAGAVVRRFVYDTTSANVPAYMVQGAVTYRILTDPIGSVRLVVDTASGQIVQQMDYDGFGQVVQDTSPGFQPFGFAGGLYDRDTHLIRFGARDYDPELGRFDRQGPDRVRRRRRERVRLVGRRSDQRERLRRVGRQEPGKDADVSPEEKAQAAAPQTRAPTAGAARAAADAMSGGAAAAAASTDGTIRSESTAERPDEVVASGPSDHLRVALGGGALPVPHPAVRPPALKAIGVGGSRPVSARPRIAHGLRPWPSSSPMASGWPFTGHSPGTKGDIESARLSRDEGRRSELLLGLAAALAPAALEAQGIPLGSEFQVNTYTTGRQGHPSVASRGDGELRRRVGARTGQPGDLRADL